MEDHTTNEPTSAVELPIKGGDERRAYRAASASRLWSRLASGHGAIHLLPPWVWGVFLVLAVAGMFTSNPLLTPCCVIMVPMLATLLWFEGEPPVLLFACVMQWVQATAAVFFADFKNIALSSEWEFGGVALYEATWLTLLGVLVLAVGMRLALLRRGAPGGGRAEREVQLLDPVRIFVLYLIAFAFFALIGRVAYRLPGLTQPMLAAMTVKWVLVFLLTYSILMQRRRYALLGVTVGTEFFTGLLGYFSTFKSVLFVLLVVLPSAQYFFRGRRLVQFSFLTAAVVAFGLVWTAIKSDYREFLNQGTGQQVVLVPVVERISKLGELAGGLTRHQLLDAWENLILRASYVRYFALAIEYVPANVPHEEGRLWLGAVKHVFTPRLFFPDKPAIHDSERTSHYTGVQVAGVEQGASIGIGYVGESYVDFGRSGMFVPILLLGVFYGLIYRLFVDLQPAKVIGFAIATAILTFGANTIETSNTKLIGGNTVGVLVLGIFALSCGRPLWKLITAQPRLRQIGRKSHRKEMRRMILRKAKQGDRFGA